VTLVADEDRRRWDERYAQRGPAPLTAVGPPLVFAAYVDEFPSTGRALDLACGQGATAVWLARRGLEVFGVAAGEGGGEAWLVGRRR
jgi:2-polyprenyl-3-methyl-5-hydroxy-6-metoxy-1,4-benzoquinol methylase